MTRINNVRLHEWSHEGDDGLTIDKSKIEIPDNVEIYNDFRQRSEEKIGHTLDVRKTDDYLVSDIEIDIGERAAESLTLAPAFAGEVVESEEGELKFVKGGKLQMIGLTMGEHENPDLSKNIKQALEDDEQ